MLPLSIALRAVAEAWMSEFRDLPSLVYSCFLSIPLRYGAHLLFHSSGLAIWRSLLGSQRGFSHVQLSGEAGGKGGVILYEATQRSPA